MDISQSKITTYMQPEQVAERCLIRGIEKIVPDATMTRPHVYRE